MASDFYYEPDASRLSKVLGPLYRSVDASLRPEASSLLRNFSMASQMETPMIQTTRLAHALLTVVAAGDRDVSHFRTYNAWHADHAGWSASVRVYVQVSKQ